MLNIIVTVAEKILYELQGLCGFSETEYRTFKTKFKNMRISVVEPGASHIRYDFYTEEQELYSSYKNKQLGQSHVVEYPPILRDGIIIPILPIINVIHYSDYNELLSSAYHELVHYFSIGKWKIIDANDEKTVINHYSGIVKKQYIYSQKSIELINSDESLANEVITDFIAQKLFEKLEGTTYHSGMAYRESPIYNSIKLKYSTYEQARELIRAYFNNDFLCIQERLLSG